jgi:plastocyanin
MRSTTLLLALAASVSAATISIDVGQNGALKFNPDSVTAATGDT